ncbi:class 1 isoprenoid biosynthesis enzyme [Paenibacillus pasadenensis]|uniref:class 1 isoprenoid biosynthesis enzyme n=1 Tax=Paenibacillus pasadenensis TaxID=217090 RepID=UPI002041FB02|nr:class 1 isoprenoid biosynthesis enzyme [Paenibacillus pasadenensis]MCM3747909.1 class 1 isoprenoid biosynthesis enzyme [Paenibacillus pasadenensis]
MPWSFEAAKREAGLIFAEAKEGTDRCPEPMRSVLRELIEQCDPSGREGGSNYMTYLLPLWYGEKAGIPAALSRDFAVGSVYMMLHYFLLDDVMDGEETKLGPKVALAAGQLLHTLFVERYGRHFHGEAGLWDYYRDYTEQWSSAVSQEGIRQAEPEDAAGLALKSAPVKIGAAAVWLAAGRPERIPAAERAVDLALASLQLADDWADWQEDLAAGEERSNAFLTLARRELGLPKELTLTEKLVRRAIFHYDALERLGELIQAHRNSLSLLGEAPSGLTGFQHAVLSGIEADARSTQQTASELAVQGGFSHFVSNIPK